MAGIITAIKNSTIKIEQIHIDIDFLYIAISTEQKFQSMQLAMKSKQKKKKEANTDYCVQVLCCPGKIYENKNESPKVVQINREK